jgi:glycine/D-amino acid oxidase-like deaminating enzyme
MTMTIVGGGLAGATAAAELRERGYDGPVVLYAAEHHLPYERPPLSKGFLLGRDPLERVHVHDAAWYREHDIDLRLGTRVTAVNPDGRRAVHRSPARDGRITATPPAGRRQRGTRRLPAHHRGQRATAGGIRRPPAGDDHRGGLDRA